MSTQEPPTINESIAQSVPPAPAVEKKMSPDPIPLPDPSVNPFPVLNNGELIWRRVVF